MYRFKKHIKLEALHSLPQISDIRSLLSEAQKARACTVELPWHMQDVGNEFSLTVQVELGGSEPIWTLYQGTGTTSKAIWSSPFDDLELLLDVIGLSMPVQAEGAVQLPPELAHDYSNPKMQGQSIVYPQALAPPPGQVYPPGYVSYPQVFMPGFAYYPPGYFPVSAPPNTAAPGYIYPNPANISFPPGYLPAYISPVGNEIPASAEALAHAKTLPVTPASAYEAAGHPQPALPEVMLNHVQKRPNILLGHFLVESGLIPESTLEAALRLQELVKVGALTTALAAQAVKRAEQRGGRIDPELEKAANAKLSPDLKRVGAPLGQILAEAGLISRNVLKSALKLQEVVRTGAMTAEQACQGLYREYFGVGETPEQNPRLNDAPQIHKTLRLLVKADLITERDIINARNIRQKHGGQVSKILVATGKIDEQTFACACEIEESVSLQKLKLEQAIITLHYCHRMRTSFKEALVELGWNQN